MAHFVKGPAYRTPFGKNVYRGSSGDDDGFESYTFAASTCPNQTIDGYAQKVLQPGTACAKITSGAETGKIGPVDVGATDGRQTAANIVGFNDTFLPYQLMDRDVEIAVMYKGVATSANCFEVAAGAFVALGGTTLGNLKTQIPGVLYRKASTEL